MSRTIRLTEEAYERLAALKADEETFSDVVLRLAGERSLLELAGILSDEEAADLETAIEKRRRRRRASLDETASEFED